MHRKEKLLADQLTKRKPTSTGCGEASSCLPKPQRPKHEHTKKAAPPSQQKEANRLLKHLFLAVVRRLPLSYDMKQRSRFSVQSAPFTINLPTSQACACKSHLGREVVPGPLNSSTEI